MGLHTSAGDGQAQADTAIVRTVGGAKLYEGFEYFAKPFLRQALAVIENFQAQGAVVFLVQGLRGIPGMTQCVVDQVGQGPLQRQGTAGEHDRRRA